MSRCLVTLVSESIVEMYLFMSKNAAESKVLIGTAQSCAAGMPNVLMRSMHESCKVTKQAMLVSQDFLHAFYTHSTT